MKKSRITAFLAILLLLTVGVLGIASAQSGTGDLGNKPGSPVLFQPGDSGEKLQEAKQRLYELGYFTDTHFSGKYTAKTETAVLAFQKNNHLEENGVITEEVWAVLFSESAVPYRETEETPIPSPTPVITESPDPVATPTLVPTPTPSSSEPKTEAGNETLYRLDDAGDKRLYQVKLRLYALGYFQDTDFSEKYTTRTEEVVRQFQQANGLAVTGVLTQADLDAIFSDDAVSSAAIGLAPTPTPLCTQRPLLDANPPLRDEDGYLAQPGEYTYEDDDGGQWVYLSDSLQVLVNRYEDTSIPRVWFESEILVRNGEALRTVHLERNAKTNAMRFEAPDTLAAENHMVFAFTDDFYDYRIYHRQVVGIVLRNGEIISEKTYGSRARSLPNLDMMAQYPDGSLKCFAVGETTAQELQESGAVNVYCFGPIVVRNGQMEELLYQRRFHEKWPRQFLGMIEPNHYLVLTVQGRVKESCGISCQDAAYMLLERNVTEALNLDGGNTMAIVFRGRMLNSRAAWKSRKYVRSVSSLIGVGESDYLSAEE